MTVSVPDSLARAGWLLGRDGTAIEKSFSFKTFPQCMAFMQAAAFAAESLNHHPEWTQVYNRLHIVLTTHDTGGLSERDVRLAEAIETILKDGFV